MHRRFLSSASRSIPSASLSQRALRLSAVAAALALALPAAQAQTTPPDAGQTLRDLQRPDSVPPQRGTTTLVVPADADVAGDPGLRFKVDAVRIEGAQDIPVAELQPLVAELAGKEASLGELRQAAQRITRLYRERGFVVARAYLPAQEIRDGTVVIAVLEGSLNSSSIDNRSPLRASALEAVVMAQDLNGKAIKAASTDRTLLLLADLPGMGNVSGNLKPGEKVGTSDLIISAEAGKAVEGDITLDNFGNRYTGQNRLNGHVAFNSPRGVGDRADLRATVSDEKLLFGRAAYDTPLNSDGLRGGAALSSSRYELGQEFARLDASGTAHTASLYGSWPLLRGLNRNVWFAGSAEYRKLRDEIASTQTTTEKNAQALTLESYGDLADALGGGAYNTWRIAATAGHLKIDTAAAELIDQAGPKTAGSYQKLQVSASRLQNLAGSTLVSLAVSGQLASKNLDSSEKFVVGGAYGVRAYPQGEGAGDEGWLMNLELRQRLGAAALATVFYDQGQAKFNHSAYTQATANKQMLRGYGVGLSGGWGAFSASASLAWRGSDAAVTAPDHRPRAWLALGWRF